MASCIETVRKSDNQRRYYIDGNSLSAQETCEACGFRTSDAPAEDTCDCKREND